MTLLQMKGITKRFDGVVANDGISLSVNSGEIHALMGENGAGKSTLMNILYGLLKPDAGEILVDGKAMDFTSPLGAIAAGIGMVHQTFRQFPDLTVWKTWCSRTSPGEGRWFPLMPRAISCGVLAPDMAWKSTRTAGFAIWRWAYVNAWKS